MTDRRKKTISRLQELRGVMYPSIALQVVPSDESWTRVSISTILTCKDDDGLKYVKPFSVNYDASHERALPFYIEQFRDSAELLAKAIVPNNADYVSMTEYKLNKYIEDEVID